VRVGCGGRQLLGGAGGAGEAGYLAAGAYPPRTHALDSGGAVIHSRRRDSVVKVSRWLGLGVCRFGWARLKQARGLRNANKCKRETTSAMERILHVSVSAVHNPSKHYNLAARQTRLKRNGCKHIQ
jgi:hypothetical protein